MQETAALETSEDTGGRRTSVTKLALGGALVVGALALTHQVGGYIPALATWVESQGAWGPAIFIVTYALATVLFIPGALMTLAGGAIFGVLKGTIYVFLAAVLGSGAAFLTGRYFARDWIESRLESNPRFAAVDRAVAKDGLKITFLLRLSPVFPFNFINYALGLTQVSFRDYMLAAFGMLPGTLLYVYYGRVIGDVAALAGGAAPERSWASWGVTILGLAATIAVMAIVTRTARRALGEAEES
jgi:uncharacterized membrane protein YdjX (TVP38/TMEM64 family)